jgi:hypothetical protein
MPEGNTAKFQQFVDQHNLIVEVRSTTQSAPEHLEQGAVAKPMDVKSKTIKPSDVSLGAAGAEGTVGYFKPQAEGDLSGGAARRWWERDQDFWENAHKMSELQKPVAEQQGTHNEIQVGFTPEGELRAVGDGKQRAITGDHDVWDIRHADGTPLSRAEYEQAAALMQQADMGVLHGAQKWWQSDVEAAGGKMTLAEQRIKEGVEAPLLAGHEGVIRFAPGQAPRLVQAR